MELCKIRIEQCVAARRIEDEFGTPSALAYLVGEKFLNFLEAAETHADFRAEIPAFVAEIKAIFEPWQLVEYLETAQESEPFDPSQYDRDEDPEDVEMDRQEDIARSARDLLLVERAREWLLESSVEVKWVYISTPCSNPSLNRMRLPKGSITWTDLESKKVVSIPGRRNL